MNSLQSDLIDRLSPDIQNGRIAVIGSDVEALAALKSHYPVSESGIAWERLPGHQSKFADQPKKPFAERSPVTLEFLHQFSLDAGIAAEDRIQVFGDGVTDKSFELTFGLFVGHALHFFELPQSTFVLKEDYSWCFCYTFEDDIYYGSASNLKHWHN